MNSDLIFNFEIVPVDKKLDIWNHELLSNDRWDNLFYRGQFFEKEIDMIRCITPCRNCYHSWFNITYLDFYKNSLQQLVKDNYLTNEIIKEKGIAEISDFGKDAYYYKIKLEASAEYVQVRCKSCNTKHFLVLGITETQPGLYGGQLHGVWRIKE